MTLLDVPITGSWSVAPVNAADHPPIADFLATAHGLSGRKFAADSRDVAEQLASAFQTSVLRDENGRVRGYAAVRHPHCAEPEIIGEFVIEPEVPSDVVDDVVSTTVRRFEREATDIPGAFLRVFIGSNQPLVIDALKRRGAQQEAEFVRTRKPLQGEDAAALEHAEIPGLTVIGWSEVISRGLSEQVRRLQHATFLEHFGNMSKTPEDWEHHIHSRAFTPDFSNAAVDEADEVVGYVIGSTFTSGAAPAEERSAHTDYIGVRPDLRRLGIGELLLRKIWLAALRRGLTVASLGTDINNGSKAHLLYRRLGYIAVEQQFAYRIDTSGISK
ncbi:GNAT family N-acetyltransferase [Candidatus Mycolicibacterium alkanivorans]|uniref:GNAT family N-acetyltransferase n=1 Tax=Candidatus Mycolicibacterium alkanivorans TaxID=2954114 RepID=A0ABS9YY38_9MYCO|nr:GNAT family N-acetyltransferase [Candidatus Mycolicibacterium alkanivorans]MCI4675249.1 GNAT family N-acetyltransferase [Candidatus Mycolicibacterium alkanivorans]